MGIPSIRQLFATASYGEPLFDPNLNLVPFADGISMGYILNVVCFVPLGFLIPLISTAYEKPGKCFAFGIAISFVIEISQLFTRYRATDIDDITANALGVMAGWLILKLILKSSAVRRILGRENTRGKGRSYDGGWYLPVITAGISFLATFIS